MMREIDDMKLKEGMYVRTKDGIILKIKDIEDIYTTDNEYIGMAIYDNEGYFINDVEIVKTSHNIIDLIEEKDLLEIEYFSLRYEKRVTRLFEVTYKEGRFINLDNAKCQFMLIDNDWTDNDKELEPIIKSIVTKEQFESMEYKVEDK